MYKDCPICPKRMKLEDVDSRDEWCRSTYYCETCDQIYSKLVTYKTQSDEIESEEWEGLPGNDPMFEVNQYVHYTRKGAEARGRILKRHVSEGGEFHYHLDSPAGASPDVEFEEDQLQLIM